MQYAYIMINQRNGTLYIGTTRNLEGRVKQHKENDKVGSFTERYGLKKLVYYEAFDFVMDGVLREKQMKKWRRAWKIKLIEAVLD